MSALYGFALVVGVGMFLFSLAADLFGGADVDAGGDVDLDVQLDVDADVDTDLHVDHDVDGDHAQAAGFRILSLRNATYFLFAFGVSGTLLTWLWAGQRATVTALFAVLLGLVGGAISTFAFGWMKRTETGRLPGDRGWIGLTGRVTLPLSIDGTGKILVVREGREHELLARPFDSAPAAPERWSRVLVLDMQQGVALVSPGDPALEDTEMRRIAPETES